MQMWHFLGQLLEWMNVASKQFEEVKKKKFKKKKTFSKKKKKLKKQLPTLQQLSFKSKERETCEENNHQ